MNITDSLNFIIGTILVLTIGFFTMEFILAAITLATGFEKSKDAIAAASKQMTSAIKGLLLSLSTFFLLNTLLKVFGINDVDPTTITTIVGNQFDTVLKCLRNFRDCR